MECLNPLCSKKGKKYKSQRGINRHLYGNKNCTLYYLELYNNNNLYKKKYSKLNTNTQNNFHDTEINQPTKQICTERGRYNNNVYFYSNNIITNTNYTLPDNMELLLSDLHNDNSDNDDNSIDDTYSINSESSLSSNDTYLNDDDCLQHEQVLGNIFTRDQRYMIKLIKLLEDMNCSDTAVTKIIDWAREAYLDGFEFQPPSKTRHGNLQWMKKMVVNDRAFYHQSIPVALNNQTTVEVISYNFKSQLLRLLQNKHLMTKENLLIDIQNPTAMYKSPNNILSEALSGSAYKKIYTREHNNHTSDRPLLVVPICLWGDATHIDTAGRFKLEPWSFSPLIFKEEVRRKNQFWGMLGYIKHLKNSTAQNKKLKKGDTHRMYHRQLSAMLDSLIHADNHLKNIAISFDNKIIQYYDITCPVLYVIADTEGADKICGRYACHNIGMVQRHCRMCNVNSENLDNPTFNYEYLKFSDMHHIALHGTKEQRVQYSQHDINNAFHAVNFGGQERGLLFATPPDILHVVRKGIVEWSVKSVLEHLTDGPKAQLDELAIEFKNTHRQQYRNAFPKTSFASGFTNLSNIRASEWVGILYLMCILAQKGVAWDIIDNALKKGNNGKVEDVLNVFEMILCFEAWINQPSFFSLDDNDMLRNGHMAILTMMLHIKRYLPKSSRAQGWKNPKFHLLLHYMDMICNYGAPKNYDSQCPEKNHKYSAKLPGRRSKKTNLASEFENQVARRVSEAMIIDELYVTINSNTSNQSPSTPEHSNNNDTILQSTNNATYGKVLINENNQCIIKWKKKENDGIVFPVAGFAEFLVDTYDSDEVVFCTEYVRAGTRYRCHPKYGKHGAYYDWLLVNYDDGMDYPCKLIACIPGEDNGFEGYDLIIQESTNKLQSGSILFHDYVFSPDLVRIDANCVQGQCFVVESAMKANRISLALDQKYWPDCFI